MGGMGDERSGRVEILSWFFGRCAKFSANCESLGFPFAPSHGFRGAIVIGFGQGAEVTITRGSNAYGVLPLSMTAINCTTRLVYT